MDITFFSLLMVSFVFICGVSALLYWAIFTGQFDNSEANAKSILADDDTTQKEELK